MVLIKKFITSALLTALVLSLSLLAAAPRCQAQSTPLSPGEHLLGTGGVDSTTAPALAVTSQPTAADPAAPSPPQVGLTADDSDWHFSVSPYLWFPGVHGTIGALGRDTSIHVSPADLLSHFRFGLMGLLDARYKRVVLPLDMVWVRLGDNKALAFPNLMVNTAKLTGSEFILTPKIGFRLVDQEKFKIDALVGLRYWHFGENLKFTPSNLNLNFSKSQNWVDPVVGGRISGALSPKVGVTIAGDVGGWGTGSQLDYQVAGLLGYKIKPNMTLQAGYRYLFANYRNGGSIIEIATSGVLFGVTLDLK
jgi:hypothetical protein